ncbi:NERD domain-containing protein [Nocardia salmonicida]|uniref:NERD domain-containing protein n=1 Tax=Nocardia salmonicida TaxID=53431 RepID=UPI00343B1CDC
MTSPPRPNPAAMPRHRPSPINKPATMAWTPITESEHIHERRGLATILERLPSANPWRAWSNFESPASDAKPCEIDLLLTTPSGLHMIELKAWSSSVEKRKQIHTKVPLTSMIQQSLARRTRLPVKAAS